MYILRSLVVLSAVLTLNLLASEGSKTKSKAIVQSPLVSASKPSSDSQKASQAITAEQASKLMVSTTSIAKKVAIAHAYCSGSHSCDCPNCLEQFDIASIADSLEKAENKSEVGGLARTLSQLSIRTEKKT